MTIPEGAGKKEETGGIPLLFRSILFGMSVFVREYGREIQCPSLLKSTKKQGCPQVSIDL